MKLKLCTYNIRYDHKPDGINAFAGRAPLILREFPKYGVDVIGFQEMLPHMRDCLESSFSDLTFVGTGRNSDHGGEHTVIAYRASLFRLMALDTFWLSPTPFVPGSKYPDQSVCPRICTCAVLLTREDGKLLRVYNTHLDHVGKDAKIEGMRLVLSRILADDARYGASPSVLMGDFNQSPGGNVTAAIEACTPLGGVLRCITEGIGVTAHAYHPEKGGSQIDYIYTNALCDTAAVKLTDTENGVYLSDHYPVMNTIEL